MFENKKRKEEREKLIAEMEKVTDQNKTNIIKEDFQKEISKVEDNISKWNLLRDKTNILMENRWDKVIGTNITGSIISIVYREKEDIPSNIYCDAQTLGLIATCQKNSYYTMYHYSDTKDDYQIDLEVN